MADQTVGGVGIKVSGAALDSAVVRDLISVRVDDALDHASAFTIRLNTWNMDQQRVSWADGTPFCIGSKIEIALGYAGASLTTVMVGEIVNLEVEFAAHKPPTLTVTGYDARYRLARPLEKPLNYEDASDSDIASTVIQRNSLTADVTDTKKKYPHVGQDSQTDLHFLNELAWKNLYDLTVTNTGAIRFGPPPPMGKPIALLLDRDLVELNLTVNGGALVKEVDLIGNAPNSPDTFKSQKTVEQFAGTLPGSDTLVKRVVTDTDHRANDQEEADLIAKAILNDYQKDVLTGSGRCHGNPLIRAGAWVSLQSLGRRFSGNYRVTGATHSLSAGSGYDTSFQLIGGPG